MTNYVSPYSFAIWNFLFPAPHLASSCSSWSLAFSDYNNLDHSSILFQVTLCFLAFPCGSAGKGSTHNVGDLGSILGLGWCPGEGKGYPLQYSGLENSMDYTVLSQRVRQDWVTFHFHLCFSYFILITQKSSWIIVGIQLIFA